MESNTMLRRIIAMIISGTVLTWAIPPPPSINLTTTALASPIDLRAETWGGFYDNNCFDITYLLSDTDMNKDDKKNTIEPYLESPVLMAKCWDLMGNEKCSRLELGDCLINQNGYLRAGEGGGFHKSCSYCRLTDRGRKLSCYCYRDYVNSPQVFPNEVNLNEFIHNFNGQLRCFGNRGPRSDCPSGDSYDPHEGD